MLLDRIEIDSCGSLERIQLGPFSHRLNAIYGARGAGKTTTLEFLRSVMLGTDRQWHRGATGSVVWADHEGLLYCRRERDGTPAGRLSVDYVARNGHIHDHHYGYRDPRNYHHLDRMSELPRQTLDAIVAATHQTSVPAILDACRAAGLDTVASVDNEAAIARLRETIATLKRQLAARPFRDRPAGEDECEPATFHELGPFKETEATRAELEATRDRLLAELEEIARLERMPARHDQRRDELTAELLEAHDEVARLGRQESQLRLRLSEIETELAKTRDLPTANPAWRDTAAERRELEALDNQLMRWRSTLREVCSVRESLAELWAETERNERPQPAGIRDPHYHNSHVQEATEPKPKTSDVPTPLSHRTESPSARPLHWRLEAIRRQLEILVQRYDSPTLESRWFSEREEDGFAAPLTSSGMLAGSSMLAGSVSLADRATLRGCIDSLRVMRDELSHCGRRLGELQAAPSYDAQREQLRLCHDLLIRFIDRLLDLRNFFLLLIDQCPTRPDGAAVQASRRQRLEQERTESLDKLGRTVSRLDERGNEIRLLQIRLREIPAVEPKVDARRRDACRSELGRIEELLRWLDSRATLQEELQRHQRHLEERLREANRPSPLMAAASRWLAQLGPQWSAAQGNGRLWTEADGTLRVDGRPLERTSPADRQTIAMAIRMAAAEELSRRGSQVPLLLDDPAANYFTSDAPARLAAVLARYSDAGRQIIVLTESRSLADAIRTRGGRVQSLATPEYIQLRYRDDSRNLPRIDTLANLNRDLDTAWREANGLYDDPHWYRSIARPEAPRRFDAAERNGVAANNLAANNLATVGLDADRGPVDRVSRGPASPFFLTGDSPVDQAPSIDAVAAERLAQVGILRVGQLLAADPRSLAEQLQLTDVTPRVVRRWQGEAELVCTVPQLRNFDARVLVGCGFTDAGQLAQMHPGHLLDKVEAFLATEQGRRILQSGTSYELSRITSWIAAANRSVARQQRHGQRQLRNAEGPSPRGESKRRNGQRQSRRGDSAARSGGRSQRNGSSTEANPTADREVLTLPRTVDATDAREEAGLRFYLHRRSPVVDAPSIGPKAAARLNRLGIHSVADLLEADPAELAERLGNRRVDSDRVLQWQQQAELVCRVPQLRGHDAQLLVAVDLVDPDQLAECDPSRLAREVATLAASPAGRRILRGGKQPDRAEVAGWIHAAQQRRSLRAA
ncbi:DUF4332 domain-containing protein [Candidatus Laterigemmans baculatus]|uniref:DUF4332 domain-containing protein n=1 Tax=Candidatus Laterigemmans baculatus TaxID=2770505 RepID=UPI0013D98209|nr:DUF4332 domain-containing protein [Candidatus Laterigemmans baculatus]